MPINSVTTPRFYTHSEGREEERERRESQWEPIDGMARQEGGELGGKSPRSGPETRRCDLLGVWWSDFWAGRILGQWFAGFRLETGVGREPRTNRTWLIYLQNDVGGSLGMRA